MAFGVTQNPPSRVEACVYLVGSYRAKWKAPVQEQSSEQGFTPAAFSHSTSMDISIKGSGSFTQGALAISSSFRDSSFCLCGLRVIQAHPASERTKFPSLANIRQAFPGLSWDRKRLQGPAVHHGCYCAKQNLCTSVSQPYRKVSLNYPCTRITTSSHSLSGMGCTIQEASS